MRRTFPAALLAATLLSLPPLLPAAAQSRTDSSSSSRDRDRAERDRERERERAERESERRSERAERDADRASRRQEADDDEDESTVRGGMQGRTTIDTTVAFTRGGVVDLSLISGQIRVVGWSRSEVKVSARSENGRLRFEASPSRVALDVEHQGRRNHDDMDATYELSVPTGTRVLMRSVSGDLSARGAKGEVEARSVSGEVVIEDAGRVALESVSGDVRASRVNGEARAHSVSGEVVVSDVAGDLDAESVSGDVTLRGARARVVRVETVSGDVTYDGSVDPAGRYDFNSHSGTVRLVLPSSTNATLALQTFSGEIDSAFPLTVRPTGEDRGRRQGRRMEFTLGGGGPRITAETFSGEIVIERAGSNR